MAQDEKQSPPRGLCWNWQCGGVESTWSQAGLLSGPGFSPFTSETGRSQPSLRFGLMCIMGQQCSPSGSLQALHEKWNVSTSFDTGENYDARQGQLQSPPSYPTICL